METVTVKRESKDVAAAWQLYQGAVSRKDLVYAGLSLEKFESKLLSNEDNHHKLLIMNEERTAFAAGVIAPELNRYFVSLVIVRPDRRGQGIGSTLLRELEHRLQEEGGAAAELSFYNPENFIWQEPRKTGVFHPNAPGVDVSGGGYIFLKNCGYRDFAMQNSYYIDLHSYIYPEAITERIEKLAAQGYTFEVYDRMKHCKMDRLLKSLENPLWEKEILSKPAVAEHGSPILVPVYEHEVCGFTGPLRVEANGRGYFAGIGVSPQHQGKGLAKVLFSMMCENLKEQGAAYMTLFTGENNPARNIYEAAGFSIIRTWADMRKKL